MRLELHAGIFWNTKFWNLWNIAFFRWQGRNSGKINYKYHSSIRFCDLNIAVNFMSPVCNFKSVITRYRFAELTRSVITRFPELVQAFPEDYSSFQEQKSCVFRQHHSLWQFVFSSLSLSWICWRFYFERIWYITVTLTKLHFYRLRSSSLFRKTE